MVKFDVVIGNPPYQEEANGSSVCGKINLHTIAAQKYITPQAA